MTMGGELERLQAIAAQRRDWGPRTIGRLSTRYALNGSREWVACVYVSNDDDQHRARHALTGIGPTWEAALSALRERLEGGEP